MVLGGGVFGKWLSSWMRLQGSLAPPATWGRYNKKTETRKKTPHHAGTLISDFQPSDLREIDFCCLKATQPVAFCYNSIYRLCKSMGEPFKKEDSEARVADTPCPGSCNGILLLVCFRLKQPKAFWRAIGLWWPKCQPNLGSPKSTINWRDAMLRAKVRKSGSNAKDTGVKV